MSQQRVKAIIGLGLDLAALDQAIHLAAWATFGESPDIEEAQKHLFEARNRVRTIRAGVEVLMAEFDRLEAEEVA